jgi:kynureninase
VTGWFAHAEPFQFDSGWLGLHQDARRFDMGTPAMGSVYAQLGGLELLAEIGIPAIRDATRQLTDDLILEALSRGFHPRLAPRGEDRSAIVMLPRPDPAGDVRRLAEAGFIVDARQGHVRFSPYFYNLADDHRAALECLARG